MPNGREALGMIVLSVLILSFASTTMAWRAHHRHQLHSTSAAGRTPSSSSSSFPQRHPLRTHTYTLPPAAKPFDDESGMSLSSSLWLDPRELVVNTHPSSPSPQPKREAQALTALAACPLIAVLRGIESKDLHSVFTTLRQEGLTMVSVPAESPAGIESIRSLTSSFLTSTSSPSYPPFAIGAATVTHPDQVDAAFVAGASFISCPHTDPEILKRAHGYGLLCLPGIMTPTEAFLALSHGAKVLKLFPSQAIPPGMVRSLTAVLPTQTQVLVSGGVEAKEMKAYLEAGAKGFALGSTLYKKGLEEEELRERVRVFVGGLRREMGESVGKGVEVEVAQ